jgi:hypothetical protein
MMGSEQPRQMMLVTSCSPPVASNEKEAQPLIGGSFPLHWGIGGAEPFHPYNHHLARASTLLFPIALHGASSDHAIPRARSNAIHHQQGQAALPVCCDLPLYDSSRRKSPGFLLRQEGRDCCCCCSAVSGRI